MRWLIIPILATMALVIQGGFVQRLPGLPIQDEPIEALALLVPDNTDLADAKLTAWQNAAREEGIQLEVVTANQFLRPFPFNSRIYAGLILPDSIHTVTSETLIGGIHQYVAQGGKLLLTYDAGTLLFPNQRYAKEKSLFSDLAGIAYALYDDYQEQSIQPSEVHGKAEVFQSLHIPPGKYVPTANVQTQRLSSYQRDNLTLPHFLTRGAFAGTPLLYGSDHALLAGVNSYGTGQVLFVNLPLAYLKTRNEGVLLHGFLRFFAERIVKLPILSTAPNGRGGIIFNLQIDSNANFPALTQLKHDSNLFDYGPYSIHIAAGPDANNSGDKLGFDIANNHDSIEWLKFFQTRGDQIGSYGGWLANYFGNQLSDTNQTDLITHLEKNKRLLETVVGSAITEYSAPQGTQPHSVTEWLNSHHIAGYYYTGDIGLGATRPYYDAHFSKDDPWAFPILTMGKYAAFEEMYADRVDEQVVSRWLNDVANFTVNDRVVRLIYAHPPSIRNYQKAIDQWLKNTELLNNAHQFNWYTITSMAQFMNQRLETDWHFNRIDPNNIILSAHNPKSLSQLTWLLPEDSYENPEILKGNATIYVDDKYLIITAQNEKTLEIKLHTKNKDK